MTHLMFHRVGNAGKELLVDPVSTAEVCAEGRPELRRSMCVGCVRSCVEGRHSALEGRLKACIVSVKCTMVKITHLMIIHNAYGWEGE